MLRNWRITEVWQKVLFVVVGWIVLAGAFFFLRTLVLAPSSWPYAVISVVVNFAYTLVGVRVFRGYLEPVNPPRVWWRWTGRPKAGFWLGALELLGGVGIAQDLVPHHGFTPDVLLGVLNILARTILALGYLNSSFRLLRHRDLWSERRRESANGQSTV